MTTKIKQEKRLRRHKRVRAKIFGTAHVPRLCIFRSAKHIYAQLINDEKGETILSASDLEISQTARKKSKEKANQKSKIALAFEVGKLIAEKALKELNSKEVSAKARKVSIEKVVFDRGGYKYHGRVKALAEGAREGGLKF